MKTAIPFRPSRRDDEVIVDQTARHHHQHGRGTAPRKIYVDGVGATIVAERVEYLDEKGKLVTETPARLHQKGPEEAFRQPG